MLPEPPLLVALPFIFLLLWTVFALIRTPLRFLSVAFPLTLQFAAIFAMGAHVYHEGAIILDIGAVGLPAGMTLNIDGLAVLLMGVTTLVVSMCAVYSLGYFELHRLRQTRKLSRERLFWPILMVLWIALLLLWIAADLLTIYLALEMMGLSAAAMMVLPDRKASVVAGLRYLFFMLLGSLAYLLGAGICYGIYGQIELAILARAAQPGTAHYMAMAFMMAGLMLKAAIFPMHAWLPVAHSEAWAPVSAIHAALVVKGSFFILVKLWLTFLPDAAALSQVIGLTGTMAILWGSIMALGQQQIKYIVAYSTMAQLGYLLLLFPLVTNVGGQAANLAWQGTWLLFISHALAKAAMFLSVGNIVLAMGHADLEKLSVVDCYLPHSLLVFGLASLSIIGLPVSGGFTAKWLLMHSAILSGQWHWVSVLVVGTLLGAAYIFRVFKYALVAGKDTSDCQVHLPLGKETAALGLALASIFLGIFAGWSLVLLDTAGDVSWP